MKKRSLSGIKSTGTPHLGNYLGMIRPAIDLQDDFDSFYFVAEYHALTSERDPAAMRASTHMIAANFLAFGLDPERAAFFRQSDVPEVTELSWILSCVTHMGLLERAHGYKAAKDQGKEKEINHGVFSYPVLMAADILIYDSDVVPIGRDQIQHLEMTRDIAVKLNLAFGENLVKLPEALVRDEVAVVPGTDGRKMSKSYNNIIEPLSKPKILRKQIMSVVSDSTSLEDPKDPTNDNTFALYKLFATPDELAEMEANYRGGNYGYGHAKQALYEKMNDYFGPYREKYEAIHADEDYLEGVLEAGALRVRPIVEEVMDRVRYATGLGPRRR